MLLAVAYCILKASWESHRGMPVWTSYPGGREVRGRHSAATSRLNPLVLTTCLSTGPADNAPSVMSQAP